MLFNLAIAYYKDGLQYVEVIQHRSVDAQGDPMKALEAIKKAIRTIETIISVCMLAYQSDVTEPGMSFDELLSVAVCLPFHLDNRVAQGNVPYG